MNHRAMTNNRAVLAAVNDVVEREHFDGGPLTTGTVRSIGQIDERERVVGGRKDFTAAGDTDARFPGDITRRTTTRSDPSRVGTARRFT
jgi:hypothetical protein